GGGFLEILERPEESPLGPEPSPRVCKPPRYEHPPECDRRVHRLAEDVAVVAAVVELADEDARNRDGDDREEEVSDRMAERPRRRRHRHPVALDEPPALILVAGRIPADELTRDVDRMERRPDEHRYDDQRDPLVEGLEVADRPRDRRPQHVVAADRRPQLGYRDHRAG